MRTVLVVVPNHRILAVAYCAFRDDGVQRGGHIARQTTRLLEWANGSAMYFCTAPKVAINCRGMRYDEVAILEGTTVFDLDAVKMATKMITYFNLDNGFEHTFPCTNNFCEECYK